MTKLRVLNVEDCPDDSLLIHRELVKAGYEVVFERVETAQQLSTALDRSEWDVVISDYSLRISARQTRLRCLRSVGWIYLSFLYRASLRKKEPYPWWVLAPVITCSRVISPAWFRR